MRLVSGYMFTGQWKIYCSLDCWIKLLVFRSVALDSGGSGLKRSIVRLAMRNGNAQRTRKACENLTCSASVLHLATRSVYVGVTS